MAGRARSAAGVVRRAKTATVRAVVPKVYRDVAAGAQLYGHALNAEQRGHAQVAEAMKAKAGQWMQGNRVQPGSTGNFSGNASVRTASRTPTSLPGQKAVDRAAWTGRNATMGAKAASRVAPTLAESIAADIARAAPKAVGVVGKLAWPLTAVAAGAAAVYQGAKRYEAGDGVEGAVEGAAWGAMDSISLGLATWAAGRNSDGSKIVPHAPAPAPSAFNAANAKYEKNAAAKAPRPSPQPGTNNLKGFQRPKNQAAAQASLGHRYDGPEE